MIDAAVRAAFASSNVRAISTFKVGVCCICEKSFRPRYKKMETLIYCSWKCCQYTSIDGPRRPMGVDAAHDAIIHREWDAVQWAQTEAQKIDAMTPAEQLAHIQGVA